LRLTLKADERLRVASEVFREELNCDEPVEASIFGLVDDAHASAAELLDNAIMRDGLADHVVGAKLWSVMLSARQLVVNGAERRRDGFYVDAHREELPEEGEEAGAGAEAIVGIAERCGG
jgi:hypothetical protein